MSPRPPDEQPTRILPQTTVEQPAVATAPATRRARIWSHVPSRLGRARTSTVVIGCLFVLLLGLNAALPRDEGGTTTVTTSDGRTVEVPSSLVPSGTPTAPTPTAPALSTTQAPPPTSRVPESSDEAPASTPAPTTTRAPASSSAPGSTTSRAPATTSRAPSISEEPTAPEPSETSVAPTS